MSVNFHLKINRHGVFQPYVYGSAPELGGGDISKAVPLNTSSGPYFYTATVEMVFIFHQANIRIKYHRASSSQNCSIIRRQH